MTFGTGGFRGIVNRDLTADVALQIGKAAGMTIGERIAVAMDTRDSSEIFKSALIAGLMAVGCDVVDLGVLPTPALQYYVKINPEISGGVVVTASHNPPEYNGFKFIMEDGVEATREDLSTIQYYYSMDIRQNSWSETGEMGSMSGADELYIEAIMSRVDVEAIRSAGLTVCVDVANGSAYHTTPMLLKRLGVKTITLNADPQNQGFGHSNEPTEDSLSVLRAMVVESGADIGAAHDGDGDRTIFMTADGSYVPGDVSLALMAKYVLTVHRGKVITPVSSSQMVEDVVEENGGLVKYTPVGSYSVVRKIEENKAVFGGEENGGMIFPEFQNCRDGAMALAMMLECIAKNGPLADQISSFDRYHTVKMKVPCSEQMKAALMDHFIDGSVGCKVDNTDGIKIYFDDGWILLRPSTTEDCFRIYSESKNAEIAASRAKAYKEAAETFLSQNRFIF